MEQGYYTYHIRIANRKTVQIEKRSPRNEVLGEPAGSFNYKGTIKTRIQQLQEMARKSELTERIVQELGEQLFTALFDATLGYDFFSFYEETRQERALLRIELDIDERLLPEVAALPWEFLRVPTSAGYGIVWLATAPNVIFSRRRTRWNVPDPIQLAADEPLRIALVVAAPSELGPVKYERVWDVLCALANTQAERIELLDLVYPATLVKIDGMLKQKPHVLHFIGHARIKDEQQQERGQIALADDVLLDKPFWISAERLSELFTQHRPGIVLLQACESGALSASEAFVGVASQIVQQNIPVVVAMQYEVSNATAQRFALTFYEHIAKNDPVDKAVQEGRRRISLGPSGYATRDFATPILFMRVRNGYVFQKNVLTDEQRRIGNTRREPSEGPPDGTSEILSSMALPQNLSEMTSHGPESPAFTLELKIKTDNFDVFLCYNNEDKLAVRKIGELLKAYGILPWFDEWELRPGLPFHRALEQQIKKTRSAAVFVGKAGMGPWHRLETEALLRQFVRRNCPVIPVLLSDAPQEPDLPIFLEGMGWVDFRKKEPDPMERLIWGILGKRSSS